MIDQEKRNEIIRKVAALYFQYGIRSVTMDDVVREVGISKKTLYQYFKDKSELVEAVVNCNNDDWDKKHEEALEGSTNALEKMLSFFRFQMSMIKDFKPTMMFDLRKYYPDVHERLVKQKREIIYKNVLENIIQGKSERLYRQELNAEVIAMLNLMRVESFINTTTFNPEDILTPEFFKEMFTYHIYGIVSDKGRELLKEKIKELN